MAALVVDTDGASDDAAALLIAARRPELTAVTVCGGVVDVDQAVHNVLVTLACAGRPDVAVYRGAARSSTGSGFPGAEEIHGPGGLGGRRHPAPTRRAEPEPAAGVLAAVLAESTPDDPLTILTLGPLTNLAQALAAADVAPDPSVRLVAMAGAQDAVGNVTAVAEYNVFCDPEAAAAVIGSDLDVTLVGWDVSRRDAVIGDPESVRIRQMGTERARFLSDATISLDHFCRDVQGLPGYDLPDAAAAAVAVDPSVVTASARLPVGVETSGRLTRGMTVVDHRADAPVGLGCVTVVWSIDHDRFVDLLVEALE